jgi:hypothetical protein
MSKTAFCVTGWHFPRDFYQAISALEGVDVFVISHKRRSQIPAFIFDLLPTEQILVRSNIGYDWGCYQQFLDTGIWRRYETLYFMHDDLQIHDLGFIAETEKLLTKHAVVGNGVGQGSVSYTGVNKHPYAYVHSAWKPKSFTFQHYTVRGSYFATTRKVLEEITAFEVYWDPFKVDIGFGNWSTKATCGKLEDRYGPDCFGFLSSTFGSSKYITEYYRGDLQVSPDPERGFRKDLYAFLKRISIIYLEIYYREREVRHRWFWLTALKVFLWPFSNKLY